MTTTVPQHLTTVTGYVLAAITHWTEQPGELADTFELRGLIPLRLIRHTVTDWLGAAMPEYLDAALRLLDEQGAVELTAMDAPTEADGAAALLMQWDDGAEWVHQAGLIQ